MFSFIAASHSVFQSKINDLCIFHLNLCNTFKKTKKISCINIEGMQRND